MEMNRPIIGITMGDPFGNEDDDDGISAFVTGAIDKLQPMD